MFTGPPAGGLQRKKIEPTYQPNADTWKVEKAYTDPRILVHNWHNERARNEHEADPYHQKFLPAKKQETLPYLDECNRVVPPRSILKKNKYTVSGRSGHVKGSYAEGLIKEARTEPYSHYFGCHSGDEGESKCDVGSQCNPVMTTKLAPWHHVNKTNYTPPDESIPIQGTHDIPTLFQFPDISAMIMLWCNDEMKTNKPVQNFAKVGVAPTRAVGGQLKLVRRETDKEDKSQRFPYPSQVIYGTAQNYGFVVKKKEQWAMEQMENDQFTPQWGNERQRNTVYKLSYKNPLTYTKPKTKPFKFNLDVIPPKLNDTCRPYKGVLNNLYSRYQTMSQLQTTLRQRTGHMTWQAYDGIR